MRYFSSISGGGVEQPMLPTQPPTTNGASAAKRKTPEDGDMFAKIAKKGRAESSNVLGTTAKRKLPGEETMGGLVIMRGPSTRPAVSSQRQPSAQPQQRARATSTELDRTAGPSTIQPPRSRSAKPTSSSQPIASGSRLRRNGREATRDTETLVGDGDVDEAVKQMDTEADNLRDRSRASIANMTPAALKVDFRFPPSTLSAASGSRSRQSPQAERTRDILIPVDQQETPLIERNRLMRNGQLPSQQPSFLDDVSSSRLIHRDVSTTGGSNSSGHLRRRSSMSMRGKRVSASLESSGLITRPHTSVSDLSLYKHIDPDLPESDRVRQLLIWAGTRASDNSSTSSRSSSRRKSATKLPEPNLPPLPPREAELMREIQETLIKQLAERKIDTSAYAPPGLDAGPSWKLKENEQNVRNRAREKLFSEQIENRKKEDLAWAEVAQFYNAHRDNVLATLNQEKRSRTSLSAKSKGKQRAASHEPEDLLPWESELPKSFRGEHAFDLAKQLVALGIENVGNGSSREESLQYKEDRIHAVVSVVQKLTEIASEDLDQRFSLLSILLAHRTMPPANPSSISTTSTLSNFVPVTSLPSAQNPGPDPLELLRAISRTESSRPRSDAARRAAKDVQRAHETLGAGENGGFAERKLTDVPPPTPRKAPGTPKRSTTPSAGRRG